MNLRPRFFTINALILLLGFSITVAVFYKITDRTVAKWGQSLAEKQLLYDKSRAVQSIIREITLAKQMAKSRAVINWSRNTDSSEAKEEGIYDLENFRRQFSEGAYFIAFKKDGKYYYNNQNQPDGYDPYKYVLQENKPSDSWFYDIIKENKDFHVNVNPDYYLKVTKLWIDVVLKDEGKPVGVLGTGLDLDRFIKNFAEGMGENSGSKSIFFDHNGAIQVYFDKKFIDYASITKAANDHKSVYKLFSNMDDCSFMKASVDNLPKVKRDVVASRYMIVDGVKYLAGISYIPELDWYEMALYDPNTLMNISDLNGIILAFVLTLIMSIVIYNFALNRFVIMPVHSLESAMEKVKKADFTGFNGLRAEGEMGRLLDHFREMSASVKETKEDLENKVKKRTEELDRLVKLDPMTELLNRRGMNEVLNAEMKRAARAKHYLGVLWLDIDLFKEINDSYGHAVGDTVIIKAAEIIKQTVREYDYVARWGGDEFIVLMPDCTDEHLRAGGERIREAIGKAVIRDEESGISLSIHVSIGGYVSKEGESTDKILNKADKALYLAKDSGRNTMVVIS